MFKEKWLQVHPEGQGDEAGSQHLDDSLTSLHWLQNFSILSANLESRPTSSGCPSQQHLLYHQRLYPQGTDSPSSPPAGDTAATGMPLCLGSPVTSGSSSTDLRGAHYSQTLHYPHDHLHITAQVSPPDEVDYKTNSKVKPPYSYASLICMAMQASSQPKVTLSTIYNWITENFCYYRHAEPSWQVKYPPLSSICHLWDSVFLSIFLSIHNIKNMDIIKHISKWTACNINIFL